MSSSTICNKQVFSFPTFNTKVINDQEVNTTIGQGKVTNEQIFNNDAENIQLESAQIFNCPVSNSQVSNKQIFGPRDDHENIHSTEPPAAHQRGQPVNLKHYDSSEVLDLSQKPKTTSSTISCCRKFWKSL